MTRDEQIADWIESIGGCFVMSDGEAVLLPKNACRSIALMLRNGDALSKANAHIEELEKITGDMADQIIAYHEKQMERIDHCLYESGLTAQGCWDELDDYAKQSIIRFAELLLAVSGKNEEQKRSFQSQDQKQV